MIRHWRKRFWLRLLPAAEISPNCAYENFAIGASHLVVYCLLKKGKYQTICIKAYIFYYGILTKVTEAKKKELTYRIKNGSMTSVRKTFSYYVQGERIWL